MKVNFISNLPLNETSGGWSGISVCTFKQLNRFYDTKFIGPINPPYPMVKKVISKILRTVGLKGDFSLFSTSRLQTIRDIYYAKRDPDARIDFFHGATPWILCTPPVDYVTYIDATFDLYLDIYSNRESFNRNQLREIIFLEKKWLNSAKHIFFGSNWAKNNAIIKYDLDPKKCHTILVGGNIDVPNSDSYVGGKTFLFISLDFEKKGGLLCVEAFKRIKSKYSEAELIIIGERPPNEILKISGVKYAGYLRKNNLVELTQFLEILSKACGLVHPTSMDTMGMVLIEAGYFGCPSIATNQFGIPELVINQKTGYLLDLPISIQQISQYMELFCLEDANYYQMRKNTQSHTQNLLTWENFGNRIYQVINQMIHKELAL